MPDTGTSVPTVVRRSGVVRVMWWFTGTVAFLLAGVVTLAWFGQRSLTYFPDRSAPDSATNVFPHGSDVTLETSDGLTIDAWRIDPDSPRDAAVLYLPGNGGNRAGRADIARALADGGFTVLLVEYRGYGGNPGQPTENGLIRDAQAAAAYLRTAGFEAARTIYVGESLGTSVAVSLAATDPPAGLLLRSPFTSLDAMARHQFGIPLGWLLRDHFDTIGQIGSVTAPVSVLAGGADDVVPATQSVSVADRAPRLHTVHVVSDVGHNDPIWFGPYLAEHVSDLADSVIVGE